MPAPSRVHLAIAIDLDHDLTAQAHGDLVSRHHGCPDAAVGLVTHHVETTIRDLSEDLLQLVGTGIIDDNDVLNKGRNLLDDSADIGRNPVGGDDHGDPGDLSLRHRAPYQNWNSFRVGVYSGKLLFSACLGIGLPFIRRGNHGAQLSIVRVQVYVAFRKSQPQPVDGIPTPIHDENPWIRQVGIVETTVAINPNIPSRRDRLNNDELWSA